MRIILSAISVSLLLAGCWSSGVIPMGQNQFSISKTSAACGFRDAGGVRADIYEEMNQYCRASNLYPEVTSIEALDGVIGRRCASATVEFRCVRASASPNAPSGQRPNRDLNRSPGIAADRGQFGRKNTDPITIDHRINSQESTDRYDELLKLKQLLDAGVITQEEFEIEKQKILAQ